MLAGRAGVGTEVVAGDLLDADSVRRAVEGVDIAYYLVHSMSSAGSFARADRDAAASFGSAAREAGVRRVVYLGGLGRGRLSAHLASRQEVGRILREATPTTEFRASAVIGSGSASFEIVRALVDRLPVMITPRWVANRAQPIAIEDQLAYLLAELDRPTADSEVFEVGGADVVSYGELMREYGRQRGLRRVYLPVPVLTPRLSSLWLGLVTPVYARLGRALIDSIEHDTVVTDPRALEVFDIRPRGHRAAIARALANEEREAIETRWADEELPQPSFGGVRLGSRLADVRSRRITQQPAAAFAPIRRIGGDNGWYYGRRLWQLRGLWTFWWAAPDSAAAAVIASTCGSAMQSTFGGSRPTSRIASSALRPRCACRAAPGSSSRSSPPREASPQFTRRRSSTRSDCGGSRTGTPSGRCTASSSRGCSTGSCVQPNVRELSCDRALG